ncbi:MAG: hypothetical protein WC000_05710 [Dokdonella sp.]
MTALRKLPLLLLSIVLQGLAMAVAVGPFFRFDHGAYMIGCVLVIAVSLITYYGNIVFDGIIDVRSRAWPKFLFLLCCGALIVMLSLSLLGGEGWPQLSLKEAFPRVAVSIILLWYGSSMQFSSFFLGKGVAIFMHNPATWFFRWARTKRSGR